MVAARVRRRLIQPLITAVAALALVVLAPVAVPTADATLCSGYSSYKGSIYCPASIEGVKATQYGTGKRVYLDQVTVDRVTSTSITVAQQRARACSPSSWGCGAGSIYYVYLTVPWTGTGRPSYGDVITLYGRTTQSTLVADGQVRLGYCPIDYC